MREHVSALPTAADGSSQILDGVLGIAPHGRRAGECARVFLDAASRLFKERGSAAVSIADIAATADAFPSQITYFRTKEALFVEAACRDVLYVARAAQEHAGKQLSPEDYTRALVESVMGSDALGFFIEAMTLTRRRQADDVVHLP